MTVAGPIIALPANRGGVPSLTPSQVESILQVEERVVALSVFDAFAYAPACRRAGVPFTTFCGLRQFSLILTNRSSFQGPHPSAPSTDRGIASEHEKGRLVLTIDAWRETVQAIQPTIAVAPHDMQPLCEPLTKRRRVSAGRTAAWSKKIQEGPDVGCAVMESVSLSASSPRAGFVDAIPRNENLREYAAYLHELQMSSDGTSMCVSYSMPAVIAALRANITYIECPLPWTLAAKGIAMTAFVTEGAVSTADGTQIDLNDHQYKVDIGPLCSGCSCFTCSRHCRAYIHHLRTVQEMNADILLTIHNLSLLVTYVRAFRVSSPEGRQALVHRMLSLY